MAISITDWNLQNLYPLPSGELAVRPGLRTEFSSSDISATSKLVGGFSVKSPNTSDVSHYLFVRDSTSEMCVLYITDEEFSTRQTYTIGPIPEKITVTHAVLTSPTVANLELIISSPDFDTLYGIVGGGVTRATKVESVNKNTTAVEIPRGLCVSAYGRVIIASGRHIYFSDALAPRTYVGVNIGSMPGNIYGLLNTSVGDLLVLTDAGTFRFRADSMAGGQVVSALVEPLSTYSASDYGKAVVVDDGLFGLSENGIRQVNAAGQPEVSLGEDRINRGISNSVEVSDFTRLTLFSTGRGPVVSTGSAWCLLDLARNFRSWWTAPDGYDIELVGVLEEGDGSILYVTPDRVLSAFGNTELGGAVVTGVAAGRLPTSPELSPVVREVTTSADGPGSQKAAVRGAVKSAETPQAGLVVGTDVWAAGVALREREMRSRRHQFAVRTDDITIEVAAQYPGTRLGLIDVKTRGQGRSRVSN